ncbi:MAG: dicarboxylate/amino acid:cation symporter [Pseudoleptotrichia goodfellowii]|nr:dicarboxylate/amino acid:cation symporter [Pseudoleptotrichia goodfellowii]
MKSFLGFKKLNLLVQITIGGLLGAFAGYLFPSLGKELKILGVLFTNLIQMVIVPLIFPIVVLSIVTIKNSNKFGKLTFKTFSFFFLITTLLITISLVLGKVSGAGSSIHAVNVSTEAIKGVASDININDFLLSIVPKNVVSALSEGNLLPVIFFAVFLGIALIAIGDDNKPVIDFFEAWSKAMFKIVNYAISFAPVGVFGLVASNVAKTGLGDLYLLGQFVLLLYVGHLSTVLIVFPIIAYIYKVPYIRLLSNIKDLILIAFTTGSSSVVLPTLIERSEKNGVPSEISAFAVPLGYSFNLTGACVYISLSVVFITNLYGNPIQWVQLLPLILFLTIITKGIAAVPAGALVVLLATAGQLNLPPEGVALIVAVDFLANAGRTAVNVVGNALIPTIIAKSENEFIEESSDLKEKVLINSN